MTVSKIDIHLLDDSVKSLGNKWIVLVFFMLLDEVLISINSKNWTWLAGFSPVITSQLSHI